MKKIIFGLIVSTIFCSCSDTPYVEKLLFENGYTDTHIEYSEITGRCVGWVTGTITTKFFGRNPNDIIVEGHVCSDPFDPRPGNTSIVIDSFIFF